MVLAGAVAAFFLLREDPEPPQAQAPAPVAKADKAPKAKKKKRNEKRLRVRVDRNAPPPIRVRVQGRAIGAPVIPLGLERDGALEVPKNVMIAGWRAAGPEPGERGAATITAHVDSRSGPGAFYRLDKVARGDEIKVRRKDGTTVAFVAERTERANKDNFPTERIFGRTRLPTLRLVTCDGPFDEASGHYRDNLIVYATRAPS